MDPASGTKWGRPPAALTLRDGSGRTLGMIDIRLVLFAAVALGLAEALAATPAHAIVGGAPAGAEMAAQTVMIVSTRGAACTGAVLAPDLVLTAAHCVAPPADYAVALVGSGAPELVPAARIAVHPAYDAEQFRTRRPTPDLALVKLASPLPPRFRRAALAGGESGLPPKGARFDIAGFGVTADGAMRSAGTLRTIDLPSIGTTGGIMVRLSRPEGAAGACTGDSGGPAFRDGRVAGIVGWVTGPNGARGCGGVTGITLVGLQRDWILPAARALGSPIGD